jgi:cupin 2 domain-containing protein
MMLATSIDPTDGLLSNIFPYLPAECDHRIPRHCTGAPPMMTDPDNLLVDLPDDVEGEAFETLLTGSGVTIERIVSRGESSPESGWYDQERHEWVAVLQGCAILAFEDGEEVTLRSGDHVNIPARRRHRVEWSDPEEETVWLAVHYD